MSADPRDRRTRASALVVSHGHHLLIDTSPDLRAQLLAAQVARVDAVLYTHGHPSHVAGVHDLSLHCRWRRATIPLHATPAVLDALVRAVPHAFPAPDAQDPPRFTLCPIGDPTAPFYVAGVRVQPVPLWHGRTPTLGFRIGGLAYLTDVDRVPGSSLPLLQDLDALVLDVLREYPSRHHFHLDAALRLVADLRPRQAFFTHLDHYLPHAETAAKLPSGVQLAHDGLVVAGISDPPLAGGAPRPRGRRQPRA